jgi:hypothetical protein
MSGSSGTGPASYTQKAIDATISLGTGTFGQSGSNTVKLSNLRIVTTISKAGMPSFDKAEIRIFGLPTQMMNQLTVLQVPTIYGRPQNTILIEAGDSTNGMSTVFFGDISYAYQALSDQPETYFQVTAWTGRVQKLKPATPSSFQTQTNVASAMQSIAQQMGFAFENGGVNVQLASSYWPGSALDQAHALARAAAINLYVDSGTNPPTLAIWPSNQSRPGNTALISPQSGLVGYPQFQDTWMKFRCLLNPALRLGGIVQMQSSIQPACGQWCIVAPFTLNLAAQMPQGPWFCDCTCTRAGSAQVGQ